MPLTPRCELVLRELKRIQMEELQGRRTLELEGAQDPSKQGLELPKFGLGLIDQDMEEYDERVGYIRVDIENGATE